MHAHIAELVLQSVGVLIQAGGIQAHSADPALQSVGMLVHAGLAVCAQPTTQAGLMHAQGNEPIVLLISVFMSRHADGMQPAHLPNPIVHNAAECAIHNPVGLPDCEVFPVTIMGTRLKGHRWYPNSVWPVEGIEGQVIDLNSLNMSFLAQDLLDYHIQRHLGQSALHAPLPSFK